MPPFLSFTFDYGYARLWFAMFPIMSPALTLPAMFYITVTFSFRFVVCWLVARWAFFAFGHGF